MTLQERRDAEIAMYRDRYNNYYSTRYAEDTMSSWFYSGCCGCCGLYNSLTGSPAGVNVSIDTKKKGVKTEFDSPFVKFDSIQLESGKWLNLEFFIADSIDYQNNYSSDPIRLEYRTQDIATLYLTNLLSLNTLHKGGGVWKRLECDLTTTKIPLDFGPRNLFEKFKGKQFLCVEKRGSTDGWIDKCDVTDMVEVQYESPWFHNYPYPPESESGLNYLQLKLCKVI